MKDIFKLKFKGKTHKIEKEKILYVISALENQKIVKTDEKTLEKFISKHRLRDENFLNKINELWQ